MNLTYIAQGSEPVGDGGDQYTGLDRFGRVIDQRWLNGSGVALDRIQYGFDRASNRLYRANVVAEAASANQDEYYTYDTLNQLLTLQRGTLNSSRTGITGTPAVEEDFTFDPTGNWDEYQSKASGSVTLDQSRTHNPANEITGIDSSSAYIGQDAAGNVVKAPKPTSWGAANTLVYDAWNRLVQVKDGSTTVATYAYDGMNRRIAKATGSARHYYYTPSWRIIEERINASTSAERQMVWGQMGLDNLILRDRGTERLYLTSDVFNATAIVDTSGNVQERYGYAAFGQPRFMAANFTTRTSSSYDWETLYGDYRFDSESGYYQVRYRYLHPTLGRWLARDPIEYKGGINLYAYVGNRSINAVDRMGLIIECCSPEKYFSDHGITSDKYVKNGNTYSAKSGAAFSGLGIGEIIWNMLQTSRKFTAKNLDVKELENNVTARQNVIAKISKVQWGMDNDSSKVYNTAYWNPLMVPKSGVDWAAAVNDPFLNPTLYATGCKNTSMLILLGGILDTIGSSAFNKISKQGIPEISGAAQHAGLIKTDNVTPGGTNPTLADWVPGDRGYIAGNGTGTGLEAGEWIIYVGNGRFWGFFPDIGSPTQTLPEWISQVNGFAHGSATETGQRWYPGVGLQ